ncbi:MAG: four helix bundle protein [Chloroflexi bacterium]|nr:four helix bundle protein [Dehalococcoidia bacterium]MCO5202531.1 four helix bundle protein [Chloroflexota bacterium]NJD66553.1 four helix bundle protein [Chloroflexota bacterium]PWB45388.1 MAG: four helix bundle protein [Dehalococcoidia bacterium]
MNEAEFKARTKGLGVECVRLCRRVPREPITEPLIRQLVRAATSVGANYRASCRGRSVAEIISKLSIVEEEADETAYWLEVMVESQVVTRESVSRLHREANEIVAMVVASKRTLKARVGAKGFSNPPEIVNLES